MSRTEHMTTESLTEEERKLWLDTYGASFARLAVDYSRDPANFFESPEDPSAIDFRAAIDAARLAWTAVRFREAVEWSGAPPRPERKAHDPEQRGES